VREVEQKYVTEVQAENSGKLNYYTESLKGLLQEVHVLLLA
jgi:hypothetical protein